MNIATFIENAACEFPFKKAVIEPHQVCGSFAYTHETFQSLSKKSDALAFQLKNTGFVPGIKVLLFIKPSLELSIITFALFKLGCVPVFIDPGMGPKNLLHALAHLKGCALIAENIVAWVARFFFSKRFQLRVSRFRSLVTTCSVQKFLENFDALHENPKFPIHAADSETPAAIVFTSGGTGTPKGVVYTHGNFAAQLESLRELFQFSQTDVDMPAFPLFSLLTLPMGVTSVIPPMNPSKPARANPQDLLRVVFEQGVTTTSGSPAIWEKVAEYCAGEKIKMSSLRALMMFGAPVSWKLHQSFKPILPNGKTLTPYGATECLPISMIDGDEILTSTAQKTKAGYGVCIGYPVRGVRVAIIPSLCPSSRPNEVNGGISTDKFVDPSTAPGTEPGEIIVQAPQATRSYFENPKANALAKIVDGDSFWHRMGDVGYFDDKGRLWFLGRLAHSDMKNGYYPIAIEAFVNQHPEVRRSALLLFPDSKYGLAIERFDGKTCLKAAEAAKFRGELSELLKKIPQAIDCFYLHPSFPVDGRHNIKIDRLKLAHFFSGKAPL